MRLVLLAAVSLCVVPSLASAQTEAACPEGCAETEECAPDGTCQPVATEEQAAPVEAPPAPECFPACRDGYLCDAGQCVEACNPPCGIGYACNAGGTCESIDAAPLSDDRDPGYAIGGAVAGIVMAALSLGLYITVAARSGYDAVDVGLAWGGIGLPFITAPIVGGGSLSASGPGVEGFLPLRIGAWVLYGIYAICTGVAAIYAADNAGRVPDEAMIALAVGGISTEVAFVIDALHTGSQANTPIAAVPAVSLLPSENGIGGAVLGAAGAF